MNVQGQDSFELDYFLFVTKGDVKEIVKLNGLDTNISNHYPILFNSNF